MKYIVFDVNKHMTVSKIYAIKKANKIKHPTQFVI
jgi:hypothetical protein